MPTCQKILVWLCFSIAVLPAAGVVAAEDASQLQEVVVHGIRASVQAAQDIKRDAPSVVEAITSEDLGKFTDKNIADALQRVPGINIERTDGTFDSGYAITIRGLGGQYSSSTLNGRELLGIPQFGGVGGRQFDFSTVPPDILSGVTVYKTSTASLVEPGLAGQVDMHTLRPLNYGGSITPQGLFGSVSAGEEYAKASRQATPRFSATLGSKLLDNTLGLYVAGVYENDLTRENVARSYDGQQTFTLTTGQTYTNALYDTYGYDIWHTHEERTKRSAAAGLQWRPNESWEVNTEYLFNRSGIHRNDQADYYFPAISTGFGSQPVPPSAVTLSGTGPGVSAWDASQIPGLTGYAISYLGALRINYINTTQNAGFNTVWRSESRRQKVSFDYSDSATDYTISWLHPYIDNSLTSNYLEQGQTGGQYPQFSEKPVGPGLSHSDPAAYNNISFAENFQKRNRGNRQAVRIDFEDRLTDGLDLKSGARYAETNVKFVATGLLQNQTPTSVAGAFSGQLQQLPFISWQTPVLSLSGFCASNPVFCGYDNFGKGSLTGPFPTSVNGSPGDVLGFDPSQSYEIRETNLAPYAELDFRSHWFGMGSTGNVGVRGVHIGEEGLAFQGGCTKEGFASNPCLPGTVRDNLVSDSNGYWEVLPSLNYTLMPSDNVNLRFAVGKSMSLPDYDQLAPIGNATLVLPGGVSVAHNVATTGNTHLKPTTAWNYDLTGEYYSSYGAAYIVSLFYKKVQNLIVTTTEYGVTVPGQGNLLFDSTQAVNASAGHTDGFEINTNQPLSFLPSPWNGFGAEANYTYVQSVTVISGAPTRFPGSSRNNVNLTAYFEKNGFSARVAVSYRSDYLSALGTPGDGGAGDEITRPQTRVDASISQSITPHLEVILTGSNLTSEAVSTYAPAGNIVANYFSLPAVYTLELRGHF